MNFGLERVNQLPALILVNPREIETMWVAVPENSTLDSLKVQVKKIMPKYMWPEKKVRVRNLALGK